MARRADRPPGGIGDRDFADAIGGVDRRCLHPRPWTGDALG